MKKISTLICIFLMALLVNAQTLPGTYKTSWVGNTFGEGLSCNRTCGRWVQNDMLAAAVSKNGTIYTNSYWDEGGRNAGIYNNCNVIGNLSSGEYVPGVGKVGKEFSAEGWAVAVNDNNAFATRVNSIYKYNLNGSGGTSFANCKAYGLSANNSTLAASDNESNLVRLYNTSGGQIRQWSVTKPGPIAIAPNGDVWVVSNTGRQGKFWTFNQGGTTKILRYNSSGTFLGEITDPQGNNTWQPTCLAFHSDGRLMIGDASMRSQILLYNVSGTPSLDATFGDFGGIGSGVPGQALPKKFWGITGTGCDSNGNIYVVMSESGTAIRIFDTSGNMTCALYGLHFVDNVDVDPASDGTELYGMNERISVDLTKTVSGTEWSLSAITWHKNAYPDEPRGTRGSDINSTFMRRVDGHLLMFATGMYAGTLDVYKFQDELAIFCQTFSLGTSAYEPDVDGNIWYVANNTIKKIPLTGFSNGTPTFGASQDVAANPGGISKIERIYYNKNKDEMYFTGDTPAGDWGVIGTKVAKYTNWSGSRTLAWKRDLPYGPGTPGENRQKAISFTDDYFFTVGVVVRCKVNVYNTSDGLKVGEMIPGPEVNGLEATGWVDIPYGIRSFKRSNGEYLVLVEEDGFGKVLMFRWCPTGDCDNNKVSAPTISPNGSNFEPSVSVRLASATSGATIRYTTDGSTPSPTDGIVYSDAFTLTNTATVKAIAYKSGLTDSEIATAIFTKSNQVATPVISPAAGNYNSPVTVSITCASISATIRYTTDGSDPSCTNGIIYDGEFTVSSAETVKAIACKTDMEPSHIAQSSYTFLVKFTGTQFDNITPYSGGTGGDKAFDTNVSTFVDAAATSGGYTGLDFGSRKTVTTIRYYPRSNYAKRMSGGKFQGSNDKSSWVDVHTITTTPPYAWTTVSVNVTYRYMRYLGPSNSHCNVAEIEFLGGSGDDTTDTQAPTAPANVTSSNIDQNSFTLSWTASTDNVEVTGYEVFAGTTSKGTTTSTSMSVTGLACSTGYSMTVKARDEAGNWSAPSAALMVNTSDCSGDPAKLTGTQFDNITPYSANTGGDKAFDIDTATFVDAAAESGAFTGLDFGSQKNVTSIKYYPRDSWAERMNGGKFQGSNDNTTWTDVHTITTTPPYAWTTVSVNVTYRYMRYLSPNNGYCNVAEIEFWGGVPTSIGDVSKTLKISLLPNPISEGDYLDLSVNFTGQAQVNIFDIQGRTVYSGQLLNGQSSIPVSFPGGIYVVSVKTNQNVTNTRLVVR
jgi:chitodextrinase